MNISLEKTGSSAVIIVKMEKTDYQDAVKKELKHIASQVEVPGFRKGKAPYSFVEKRFGVQTKMEQVDKLLNASLLKYIEESKLEILGEPMVSSKQGQINIVAQDNFEFLFDGTDNFKIIPFAVIVYAAHTSGGKTLYLNRS